MLALLATSVYKSKASTLSTSPKIVLPYLSNIQMSSENGMMERRESSFVMNVDRRRINEQYLVKDEAPGRAQLRARRESYRNRVRVAISGCQEKWRLAILVKKVRQRSVRQEHLKANFLSPPALAQLD